MKKFKLILIILLFSVVLVAFSSCAESKPKTGYELWKKTYREQMGEKEIDDVDFNYCEFVKIEDGDDDIYYYHAHYTVYVLGTDAESETYFRWMQGTIGVMECDAKLYELAYESVINNEIKGVCGRINN